MAQAVFGETRVGRKKRKNNGGICVMVREKFVSHEEQLKKEEELVKNQSVADKISNFFYHHKAGVLIAVAVIAFVLVMFVF